MCEAIQADSMGEHLMAAKLPRIIARALSGRMVAGATIAFALAVRVSAQAPGPPGSAVVALAGEAASTRKP